MDCGTADRGQSGHFPAPAADTAAAAVGDEQNFAPGAGAMTGAQIPDAGATGGAQIPGNDGAAAVGGGSARGDHLDASAISTSSCGARPLCPSILRRT